MIVFYYFILINRNILRKNNVYPIIPTNITKLNISKCIAPDLRFY